MEPLFGPIAGGTKITMAGSATMEYLAKFIGLYIPYITGVREVYIGKDLSATSVSLLPIDRLEAHVVIGYMQACIQYKT